MDHLSHRYVIPCLLAFAAFVSTPVVSNAQKGRLSALYSNVLVHPLRYVDGKYHDVKPFFGLIADGKVLDESVTSNDWHFLSGVRVLQIVDDGIFVGRPFSGEPRLIRGMRPVDLVDGNHVSCVAKKVGTYSYTSTLGAKKTIEAYDTGIPYDPKKKGPDGRAALLRDAVLIRKEPY